MFMSLSWLPDLSLHPLNQTIQCKIHINLILNRFLHLLPNIYLLFVFATNANQITCTSNQHCLLHCTETSPSCSSVTINASISSSLTLYCNDDYSCEYTTVLCPSDSSCNIFCNGLYSCSDSIIHSNLSSTLQIYCSQHRSCFFSTIFGPQSSVHIDCSKDRSCVSSSFYLNTTPNITVTCHHTDNTDYDHSCSTNLFHVDNASYAHFQFEGNSGYGYKGGIGNVIYAMYITHALWIECTGFRCSRDLDVYCPFHASCIISNNESDITVTSLDIIQLFIPNQSYHNLNIICHSSTTCSSSDRRIIRCMDTHQTSVIGYDQNDDKWYCFLNENHCCPDELIKNNTIYCDAADCIIDCNDNSSISCSFLTLDATLSTSLTLRCYGGYQCQGSHILCPDTTCTILCNTHHSCQYVIIESVSLQSLIIHCKSNTTSPSSYECSYMTVNTSMTVDANVNITCGDHRSSRSCIWSEFNFQSVANTGNVYVICDTYSCQHTSWYIMNMNAVSFNCNARSACELSLMDITSSLELNILCDGKQSCFGSVIVCPSNNIQSCSIQCSDYPQSCRYLDIISHNKYVNVECPLHPVSNNVCNNMESHCDVDGTQPTLIMYNESTGIVQCSDTFCCPWIPTLSPTNIPTFAPTVEPTMNPTLTPTSNPSLNPSYTTSEPSFDPSIIPFAEPTVDPTVYPTTNPTFDPTTNPTTIHPTFIPTLEPTINPSINPSTNPAIRRLTKQPTNQLNDPTVTTALIPSGIPISPPHAYPTIDPSAKPSRKPTLSKKPTMNPISRTVSNPTTEYTFSTMENAKLSSYSIRDKAEAIYIMLVLILLVNIILLLCMFKYNQTALSVDDQKYGAVIVYCVQIFDLCSDIIFSAQLYQYHIYSSFEDNTDNYRTKAFYYLFVASVMFILIPYILNFCSSILIILKITHDPIISTYTKQYFAHHSLVYIIGVLLGGGSFGALQLLNTNLMGMDQLQCGLSTIQLQRFLSHKLFCTTLLQNIPNFLCQLFFIVELNIVTITVIISNASTLFNILLNVCISVIVYVTLTSKDQEELPFIINVSWIPLVNDSYNEEDDPYNRFGNRMKLSLELNIRYYPHEFEILSSERSGNYAKIYGVIKIDRSYSNKEKEIETFLNGNETLKHAVIGAFGYYPYFTDLYNFIVNIENEGVRDAYISKEMQMLLPQIWEGIDREKIGMSDDVFNKIDGEIRRINDEHTLYTTYHDSGSIESEMKRKLSTHFVD